MEIRKFIFSIVTKFDAKGFREADKAADAAGKTAARTAKYWSVLAAEQLKAARAAREAAKAQGEAAAATEQAGRAALIASKSGAKATEDLSRAMRAHNWIENSKENLGALREKFSIVGESAKIAAIGIGAFVTAGVAVATSVIRTGASFESLRTQLTTLYSSSTRGQAAFDRIKEFAKATPFEVDQVTRAFISLKSKGLEPTNALLTELGDVASTRGAGLEELVNAISGAVRGETDPLERFADSVKVSNGKITLGFRDQKVVVDQNVESITNAIAAFGRLDGVQGAMAAQSKTTNGVISNLKDAFAQFLDEVAQLGVLDEFKALLGDLINFGGPGNGLAGIVADFLVTGLRALREILAQITEEDVRDFFEGMVSAAVELIDIINSVVGVFQWFIEISGGVSDGLMNMALLTYALVAAMSGPAGLVLAAGAVGLALGNMAANLLANATAAEIAQARIEAYSQSISEIEARLEEMDRRSAAATQAREDERNAMLRKSKDIIQAEVGGLGGGLAAAASPLVREDDAIFEAGQLQRGGEEQRRARARFATAEGQAVLDAVDAAQRRQVERAAANARREASRRGATEAEVKAAEDTARRGASAAAQANRKKALETASTAFGATGSAEKAARAGEAVIEGAEKKATGGGGGKGKKGDVFFDFEKEATAAARSQAEKFAQQELENLRAEGISFEEALAQSRAAGVKREAELKQKFLDAGRVFDASANNILDILGLRGPGSVLEGRPPPQNLMIAPQINVTMIGEFNQTIESVDGQAALTEVTGVAGQAAVEAGLQDFRKVFTDLFEKTMDLRIGQLLKADGGGQIPQGPQG